MKFLMKLLIITEFSRAFLLDKYLPAAKEKFRKISSFQRSLTRRQVENIERHSRSLESRVSNLKNVIQCCALQQ